MAFEKYQHILKEAATMLPKGCPVILLADRGFDDNDLFCAACDLGWGFRIRLKKSLRVHRVSRLSLSVGCLMPALGKALFLHQGRMRALIKTFRKTSPFGAGGVQCRVRSSLVSGETAGRYFLPILQTAAVG